VYNGAVVSQSVFSHSGSFHYGSVLVGGGATLIG
jgi:hypothetical protein